jgi:transcriptional regulator with XRE-family HTH domain
VAFPQGRVALLQFVPITLKALKPKETDFEPQNLGEHIRKRRLELGLTQVKTAKTLEVAAQTLLHWEKGQTEPPIEAVSAILRFLGYDPFPEPRSLPERLLAKRRVMGWSIKEAARQLGVDEGTWRDWERGETILYRKHRVLVARLVGLPIGEVNQEMGACWNRSHNGGVS